MEWRQVPEFPRYSVSPDGDVRNDETGRILAQSINPQGVPIVGMMLDGKQYKRSVPVLVAELYLEEPEKETFDTPIHMDGNRSNCAVENLQWRPRWFAIFYHQQFHDEHEGFVVPIRNDDTGEEFPNSWEAALHYGLVERELVNSILQRTWVFPILHRFSVIQD